MRRWATVADNAGALALLGPLESTRDAVRAEAAPTLALAPPPAPALSVGAALCPTGEDWAEHDDAEAANQASWASQLDASVVQRRGAGTSDDPAHVQGVASAGVAGTGAALPHLDAIQSSFGPHDVFGVRAHIGGAAASAAGVIGAEAYATGNDVAFASSPSLFVAAHEAAHVVQQRAGVHLLGGVGTAGDTGAQYPHLYLVGHPDYGLRMDGVNAYAKGQLRKCGTVGKAPVDRIIRVYTDLDLNPPKPEFGLLVTADGYVRGESTYGYLDGATKQQIVEYALSRSLEHLD